MLSKVDLACVPQLEIFLVAIFVNKKQDIVKSNLLLTNSQISV